MAIRLKTHEQIELMRRAGQIVRSVLDRLGQMAVAGVTTEELDAEAQRMTLAAGAACLFKGVPNPGRGQPFPGAICASINEELVHGIPSPRQLAEGDILSVDFGVRLDGWCADAAETFIIGQVPPTVHKLLDVTRQARDLAIMQGRPDVRWSEIAFQMQQLVEQAGFSVVREFVGHGIGRQMWEDPKVPNYSVPDAGRDFVLREGMVIAVEPMVNMGGPEVEYGPDGWVVLTKDRLPCAHFEHTLAVTTEGMDVLTA